jgi:hypothetical protein
MIIYEQNFFGLTTSNISSNFKTVGSFGSPATSASFSRWSSNTSALRMLGALTTVVASVTESNPIYCGVAVNQGTGNAFYVRFQQNDIVHVDFVTFNGVITVRRGGSTTLATYTIPNYAANNWYYYEFGAVIDDISGSVQLRLNENTVISASGLDTRNGALAYVDGVSLDCAFSTTTVNVTDWYVTNTQGSNPATNGFLGDIRIVSTIPTASGDVTNFLPLSSSNALMVDDGNSPDNDVTFVSASLANSMDLYRTGEYTGSVTQIYGLGVKALARKTEPGSRAMQMAIKSGSTFAYSPSESILDSYRYHVGIFETNPNTGTAWSSVSDVNGTQIGFTIL